MTCVDVALFDTLPDAGPQQGEAGKKARFSQRSEISFKDVAGMSTVKVELEEV